MLNALGKSVENIAVALGSNCDTGLTGNAADLKLRQDLYGKNSFEEKRQPTYCELITEVGRYSFCFMLSPGRDRAWRHGYNHLGAPQIVPTTKR